MRINRTVGLACTFAAWALFAVRGVMELGTSYESLGLAVVGGAVLALLCSIAALLIFITLDWAGWI